MSQLAKQTAMLSGAGAMKPPKGTSLAAAANASIVSFAKALAVELAPVRVNCLMAFEVLDPGCIREPQQMHGPKNHLTIPVSVGGMDVAFHYIVVHKAVDHVGALSFSGTDDCRVQ